MPPPEPPALMPRPAKCLQCGYPRDPAGHSLRCPECGSEYPPDSAAEADVLEYVDRLRRTSRVLLASGLVSVAAWGLILVHIVLPCMVLLFSLPFAVISAISLTAKVSSINSRVWMAYANSTPATQARFDGTRRQARVALFGGVCLAIAFVVVWAKITAGMH